MDTAIGQIKRATRRLQEMKGGSWLTHIQRAVTAYNSNPHGSTGDPQNDMSDETTMQQRQLATLDMAHNMKQIKQRKTKLARDGAFRTLRDKNRGMKRRIDESTCSKEYTMSKIPHHLERYKI